MKSKDRLTQKAYQVMSQKNEKKHHNFSGLQRSTSKNTMGDVDIDKYLELLSKAIRSR